ncbi:MAG: DUF5615 family PIN-like protein [Candidatus Schekmanbacteria bacterium]|nr:DUF5615 family PIN-like protein [Candidatus Schekmanbacteria bacterium]
MKLLVDMNLSPMWIEFFEQQGWQALHWSTVGNPRATDIAIMDWARENDYAVFTHDLDFGALLAATSADKPSVIQVRTQDIMPHSLGPKLVKILRQYESVLNNGALLTVDENKSRVRILLF